MRIRGTAPIYVLPEILSFVNHIATMANSCVCVVTPCYPLSVLSASCLLLNRPLAITMLFIFGIITASNVIKPISGRSRRQQAHTHDKRYKQGENAFAKVLVMFHRFNSFLCLIYGCKVSGGRAGIARQRRSPHSFASRHFWRFANYKVVISNRLP